MGGWRETRRDRTRQRGGDVKALQRLTVAVEVRASKAASHDVGLVGDQPTEAFHLVCEARKCVSQSHDGVPEGRLVGVVPTFVLGEFRECCADVGNRIVLGHARTISVVAS